MIITDFENIERQGNSIVTLGTFDGVHRGHQFLISQLVAESRTAGARSVLVTFDPHPQAVINPEHSRSIKILTTLDERKALFEKLGLDVLVVAGFTKELAEKTGEEFVKEFLIGRIGMGKLLIGYDHAFGKKRSGNYESLLPTASALGFEMEKTLPYEEESVAISSTTIRKLIAEGNLESANALLGRAYRIQGEVIKGDGRGKSIGFPTANLKPDHEQKLIPARGVYACRMRYNGKVHFAVANIGLRPTFTQDTVDHIELHVLEFEGDLYGQNISVEFLYKIREEMKFSGAEALIEQIKTDVQSALSKGFSMY